MLRIWSVWESRSPRPNPAAKDAIERSGVEPHVIDQIVIGNVVQSSKDAIYLPGHIGLKAGVPIETPALAVNRLCGSGFQAIVTAAEMLLLGDGQVALAGGAENMTQAQHGCHPECCVAV